MFPECLEGASAVLGIPAAFFEIRREYSVTSLRNRLASRKPSTLQNRRLPYQGPSVARRADGSMPLVSRTPSITGVAVGRRSNVFRFPGPPNHGSLRKKESGLFSATIESIRVK